MWLGCVTLQAAFRLVFELPLHRLMICMLMPPFHAAQALLLNPFDEEPPAGCRHELRRARLDALDDKERS